MVLQGLGREDKSVLVQRRGGNIRFSDFGMRGLGEALSVRLPELVDFVMYGRILHIRGSLCQNDPRKDEAVVDIDAAAPTLLRSP